MIVMRYCGTEDSGEACASPLPVGNDEPCAPWRMAGAPEERAPAPELEDGVLVPHQLSESSRGPEASRMVSELPRPCIPAQPPTEGGASSERTGFDLTPGTCMWDMQAGEVGFGAWGWCCYRNVKGHQGEVTDGNGCVSSAQSPALTLLGPRGFGARGNPSLETPGI